MALAAEQTHRQTGSDEEQPKTVAVIGDGALTAGLAYEALNHAGGCKANMLVVLNDNDMSISPNVGAMNKYLARILTGKFVSGAREGGKKAAIITLLGDMLKGLIPVLIAVLLDLQNEVVAATAVAAFLGHLFFTLNANIFPIVSITLRYRLQTTHAQYHYID